MQAGAFALLLIGAVNLTNLLLIRASSRAKEIAVRRALGASGSHMVSEADRRDHFAHAGRRLARARRRYRRNPPAGVLAVDRLPLGSHISYRLSSGVRRRFSEPPPWDSRSRRPSRGSTCGASGQRASNRRPAAERASRAAQSLRHGFIVAQIALAMVLLSGAGLLGLSLERAMAVSPGFRPDHVLYRTNLGAVEQIPGLAGSPGIQREAVEETSRTSREFWPPEWSTMCP